MRNTQEHLFEYLMDSLSKLPPDLVEEVSVVDLLGVFEFIKVLMINTSVENGEALFTKGALKDE